MQQRACGLVIFRRYQDTIQFLLMQTSYGQHHWTPPKGHVDPGESDMETALRETQEEAGFTSSDLRIFEDARHEMTYQVKGMPKTVIYWLAELLNPDKSVRLSNEHQAFEWLSLREACDLAKYAEMQKALNEFDKYISQNLAAYIKDILLSTFHIFLKQVCNGENILKIEALKELTVVLNLKRDLDIKIQQEFILLK